MAYVLLALLTLWATWRCRDCVPVAWALIASCALSNVAHVYLGVSERPALYTVLEVAISCTAFMAYMLGAARVLILVVVVSVVSVSANFAFSVVVSPTLRHVHLWELITNVCFVVECLLVASAGLSERYNQRRRSAHPVGALALDASDQPETIR